MAVVFPLSEPFVIHIFEFVGCQYHLSLPVTDISQNIFWPSSMNFYWSLPTYEPKNLDGFIQKKSQNLAAINWSFLLIGTRNF